MRAKGRRGKGPSRKKAAPGREKPARPASKPFEFLDHPADVGFTARGKTLPEIFANAARALCEAGWELTGVRAREAVAVRARAGTLEDLLYSWLSEILFLTDAENWVFKRFAVDRVEQVAAVGSAAKESQALWEVHGEARGERFEKGRHRARTYIKAVTYHQLAVRQTAREWRATVFLDV